MLALTPPSEEEPEQTDYQEAPSSSEDILSWLYTPHGPIAGVWEEILSLLQAHPEWTSTQILQEIGRQALDRAVSAPMEALIHGLGTICPALRANWEEPWPPELIQGDPPESRPTELHRPEAAVSAVEQYAAQAQPLPVAAPGTPSSPAREHEAGHLTPTTVEQAIAAYVQEMRAAGRDPKTLQWHRTSLGALQRYLWRQFHLTDVCELTRDCLQSWVTDLPIALSARTGVTRTVSTVAAYMRSARAFCNWLVRQGYVSETLFPKGAVPQAQRGLPQPVEPAAFVHLLRACQLAGSPGGQSAGMTARNRAILWLLRDTGLSGLRVVRLTSR